jgi:Protein of unknown function (DUF2934)
MKSTRTKALPTVVDPRPRSIAALEEQVCRRAHELYEQRGREEGHALDDWLQAETEIVKGKARTAGAYS